MQENFKRMGFKIVGSIVYNLFIFKEKFESETAKRSLEGLQAIGTYR